MFLSRFSSGVTSQQAVVREGEPVLLCIVLLLLLFFLSPAWGCVAPRRPPSGEGWLSIKRMAGDDRCL